MVSYVAAACFHFGVTTNPLIRFASQSGRFSVLVPNGLMNETTSPGRGQGFDGVTVHTFEADPIGGATYVIFYADADPTYVAQVSLADRYARAETLLLGSNKTLMSSTAVSVYGYPARDLTAVSDQGNYHVRHVWVGNRLYELAAKGAEAKVNSSDVGDFLGSFTLLDDAGSPAPTGP
jgi:hypothetical protein